MKSYADNFLLISLSLHLMHFIELLKLTKFFDIKSMPPCGHLFGCFS